MPCAAYFDQDKGFLAPCVHRGKAIDKMSCKCGDGWQLLYQCEVYEKCTILKYKPAQKEAVCLTCKTRKPP